MTLTLPRDNTRDQKISELAGLGVTRAYAVSHFNALAEEARNMDAEPGKHSPDEMHRKLVGLETARAIMLHSMAEYTAAVNSLVPGGKVSADALGA